MLLSIQHISNVSSVDFTSLISGSYNTYKIVFDSAVSIGSSNDAYLTVQLSGNGGSTWQSSAYINYLGGSVTTGLACAFLYDAGGTMSFTASGSLELYNLTSGSGFVSSTGLASFFDISNTYLGGQQHMGMYNGSPLVVDSIRIVSSDGSPISGNFYLYGF